MLLKVINAVWEKRNLGVDCHEIKIEINDTIDYIKNELPKNEAQYTVVKVPSNRCDLNFLLQELGYKYIESSIHLTHDLKNINLNPIQQRILNSIGYETMDKFDIDKLFCEIEKGIFTTDRIYVDPYFTHEQAANRYVNWISDELDKGCEIFKLTYKNDSIGFFTFKNIGNSTCYPFLAGMYNNYLNSGLGMSAIEKPLRETIKRNCTKVSTFVSSNNLKIFRIHLGLGFSLDDIHLVYAKHR